MGTLKKFGPRKKEVFTRKQYPFHKLNLEESPNEKGSFEEFLFEKNLYRIKLIIIGNAITAYHLIDGKNYFTNLNEKNIADNKHF